MPQHLVLLKYPYYHKLFITSFLQLLATPPLLLLLAVCIALILDGHWMAGLLGAATVSSLMGWAIFCGLGNNQLAEKYYPAAPDDLMHRIISLKCGKPVAVVDFFYESTEAIEAACEHMVKATPTNGYEYLLLDVRGRLVSYAGYGNRYSKLVVNQR